MTMPTELVLVPVKAAGSAMTSAAGSKFVLALARR